MPSPESAPNRRDLRRLAMQVLYQLDITTPKQQAEEAPDPAPGVDELAEALDEEHDSLPTRKFAAELALQAWAERVDADEKTTALAPDWPAHRQPPVDRAILRLAYFEMTSGHAPVKVAINEAVELAKQFGSEQSPPFINGVLDKLAKAIHAPAEQASSEPEPAPRSDADAWLDDALDK